MQRHQILSANFRSARRWKEDSTQSLYKLIQNIFRSGIRDRHDIDTRRRIIMGNALAITGIIILIPMGFIALAQQNKGLFLADLITAVFLIVSVLYFRISGRRILNVVVCFMAVFYYYLFVSGGVDNTAFVWVNTFPLIACFLLGSRRGGYAALVFFLLALAFMLLDTQFENLATYTFSFKIRLIASYIVVSAFAFIFERSREQTQSKFEAKNAELLETVENLRVADDRLRKTGEELEQRVRDRTAELTLSNRRLMKEMEERSRSEQSLRESEERYRYLVTCAPAGIYEMDLASRRFTSVNDVMCQYSGYTQEELLSLDPLQLLTAEGRKLFMQRLAAILSGKPVPDNVELMVKGKDGREFCVLLNTRHSYGPDNGIKTTAVVQDITERKRAETERIELERRLLDAQKLESLGIMAGGIAHDFNNLLMAILGNLEMTLLNLPASSPARATIDQAVLSTCRATDLTRQILAYTGKGSFQVMPVNLNELVRENAGLFRTAIYRTVTLNLRLVPERACIEADPGQVQQIVMNLITNAAEAIGEKPGKISLATGVVDCDSAFLNKSLLGEKPPAGKYAYLEVTDDGQGMDKETIKRIFDPFFTTKFLGRGLGMSAVLGIVRSHKGAITIESAPGRGTTIRVVFPVSEACGDGLADVSGLSGDVADTTPFSGTILVVDDEEMVREVCTTMLQRLGFRTLSAADGEEALLLLQEHSMEINLVLLDLTMPKMDGFHTFQEMKRVLPDVQVIICSGYSEEDATQRFIGSGLDGFIKKPFHLQELKEKITGILIQAKKMR